MSTAIRLPAVAGKFYPADSRELRSEVEAFTQAPVEAAGETKIRALGCVVPHAGYIYSGGVAGAVFGRLELPARCIILCPNHTGRGEPLAIWYRRMAHAAGRCSGGRSACVGAQSPLFVAG